MARRMAFVGLNSGYFLPSGRAVEAAGIRVHWITTLPSDAARLRRNGVPAQQILDVFAENETVDDARDVAELRSLENQAGAPMMNDVILMDRMLRRLPDVEARRYCATAARRMSRYLAAHDIRLVVSGRDTALQLTAMLVCRRDGRTWLVPTRTRLPRERYGFQPYHHVGAFFTLRTVSDADRADATRFLEEFRSQQLLPAIRSSAGSFRDVLARLPVHISLLWRAVSDAKVDRGSRASRYTIPDLARMYLKRKVNLIGLRADRPYQGPSDRPFVLYALHTQPESSIDVSGSPFVDQPALIEQIARAVPSTHDLYVKVHPSDLDGKTPGFYRRLRRVPGVRLIGPHVPSRVLLHQASLVCTVTGTVGYESALLGIPTITFARTYFSALPGVHYSPDVSALPSLVKRLLREPRARATPDDRRIIEFLAELFANSVPGDINRVHESLTEEDLRSLVAVYSRLLDLVLSQAQGSDISVAVAAER